MQFFRVACNARRLLCASIHVLFCRTSFLLLVRGCIVERTYMLMKVDGKLYCVALNNRQFGIEQIQVQLQQKEEHQYVKALSS